LTLAGASCTVHRPVLHHIPKADHETHHRGRLLSTHVFGCRSGRDAGAGYLALLRNHYDKVLRAGTDVYGSDKSGIWLASIDIHRGGQPDRPDPAVKRAYRQIHAPRGSNLYWDQPAPSRPPARSGPTLPLVLNRRRQSLGTNLSDRS
jgi:hypothetical protein